MHKKITNESQGLLRHFKSSTRLLLSAGLLLAGLGAHAQTTTVFSEDFEGATNSFTPVNGTEANKWIVGTAGGNGPTTAGTKAAYVSNDNGVTNAYTITTAAVSHIYRDVTFPTGQNIVQVNFDWKAGGESTYDYILVQVAPTSFTPVAGTIPATTSVSVLAQINLQAAFGRTSVRLPASVAGTTQRLIFTWRNDGSLGTQPPAVIDNVTATAQSASPISGTFTINSAQPTAGTNFQSFSDAAARLNLDGISGPTTVNVLGGPYNEQFLLNEVGGTSATNRLTIHGNGRTILFGSISSNQRAVVTLNGTDYTTIDSLNIDADNGGTPGTYGWGVFLTNGADNNIIRGCNVNSSSTSTSSNFSGIVASGSATSPTTSGNSANNLLLERNTVVGGYYGITLNGTSTTVRGTGNILLNNTVRDFYYYGVYGYYQTGAQYVGNDINRITRTTGGTFYGLYLYYNGSTRIERNRIHDAFTAIGSSSSSVYGLYMNYSGGTAAAPSMVYNNLVYNLNTTGVNYGIYNYYSDFVDLYHNSVAVNNTVSGTTLRAYYQYNSGSVNLRNNIFAVTQPASTAAHAIYIYYSGSTVAPTSNYNDLYAGTGANAFIGYYGTSSSATTASAATLTAWRAVNSSAFDQNSVAVDPRFRSATDLRPTNVGLDGTGTPTTLTAVPTDFAGVTRNNPPDVGAYEFAPTANDVETVSIDSPTSPALPGTNTVTATIRNGGTATLTSVTLSYVLNANAAVTQAFTGLTVAPGATTQLSFTTGALPISGTNTLTVTATLPNGVTDPNPSDNAKTITFEQPTPTNDEPCAAVALGSTAVSGSNSGSSTSIQPGILLPACSPSQIPKDVWFSTTVATGSNGLNVTVTGAPAGMVRVFTTADCATGPFTQVFCTSSGANNTTVGAFVVPGLTAGQRYYIAVSGYGSTDAVGAFTISAVSTTVTGTSTNSRAGAALSVYPNPSTTGQFTLELAGARATASPLTVINALGQVVHKGTAGVGTAALNLTALPAGVYTLQVQTAVGVLTQRIVRE